MHVRPSWKSTLGEALPYSARVLMSAYRMARGGCPELYVEIPLSPPTVNHIYRKIRRRGGKHDGKPGFALDDRVVAYREMAMAACWGKRFSPTGVVGVVIAIESARWVTKKHEAGQADADNPIKSVLDALKHALKFEDHIVWDVFDTKIFSRREATHVWLFDIGDVVSALGAQSALAT